MNNYIYTDKDNKEYEFETLEEMLDWLRVNDREYYEFGMSEDIWSEEKDYSTKLVEEIEQQNLGYILTKEK